VIHSPKAFDTVVRQGLRVDKGMVAFKDEISPQQLEKIRAYVIHRANEDKRAAVAAATSCDTQIEMSQCSPWIK
jgi:mono/diheme cytochrome c family protein